MIGGYSSPIEHTKLRRFKSINIDLLNSPRFFFFYIFSLYRNPAFEIFIHKLYVETCTAIIYIRHLSDTPRLYTLDIYPRVCVWVWVDSSWPFFFYPTYLWFSLLWINAAMNIFRLLSVLWLVRLSTSTKNSLVQLGTVPSAVVLILWYGMDLSNHTFRKDKKT